MDGIPAVDFWDLVIQVLHSSNHVPPWGSHREMRPTLRHGDTKTKRHRNGENDELSTVDYVVFIAKSLHFERMLYIFEDNDAVIKMSIKGRSPTTCHVFRTHRIALDWLLDRSQLGPQNPNQVVSWCTAGPAHWLLTGNMTLNCSHAACVDASCLKGRLMVATMPFPFHDDVRKCQPPVVCWLIRWERAVTEREIAVQG